MKLMRMKYFASLTSLLATAVLATPLFSSALTIQQTIGFFNVFVGLMLTVGILLFAFGFIMWIGRLGSWPSYRTEAIKVMEWSVIVLFVLVVLLGIVQFFQNHPKMAAYLVSTIVVFLLVGGAVYALAKSGREKKEEK